MDFRYVRTNVANGSSRIYINISFNFSAIGRFPGWENVFQNFKIFLKISKFSWKYCKNFPGKKFLIAKVFNIECSILIVFARRCPISMATPFSDRP